MKKLTLLAAAVLSCCTFSNTYAQVQTLRATGPFAAPRFVSDPTQLADPSQLAAPASSAPATTASDLNSDGGQLLPNPFDYFADELPASSPQAAAQDQSMLAERHHRQQRSVVDTIIDHASLGNIPHASTSPIYWGGAPQTPNPVADWLLREECVAGLWAGYPQQRAAECAHMWSQLSGHRGTCSGGCGSVAGPCSACAEPRVRNRYLSGPSVAEDACAPCNNL